MFGGSRISELSLYIYIYIYIYMAQSSVQGSYLVASRKNIFVSRIWKHDDLAETLLKPELYM